MRRGSAQPRTAVWYSGRSRDAGDPLKCDADHWVYTCRDAEGDVLYVGVTSHGLRRFAAGHGRTAVWWPDVAKIDVEHFATRGEALEAERALIAELEPPHNQVYSGGYTDLLPREPYPTRWMTLDAFADWLDVDPAWVRVQMAAGLPYVMLAGSERFKADHVCGWLRAVGKTRVPRRAA